jgi:hypothetical protein
MHRIRMGLFLLAAVALFVTALFVSRPTEARVSDIIVTKVGCRAKVKVKAKLEECIKCIDEGGKFHFKPGAMHGICHK